MSLDGLKGGFREIRETRESVKLPYFPKASDKDKINELNAKFGVDKTDMTRDEADKLLEARLASRASLGAIQGGILYQQGQDEKANNCAKENGFDKAIYKGKIDNKAVYIPSFDDEDKVLYSGMPQYIVLNGDKAELVIDKNLEITDFLNK